MKVKVAFLLGLALGAHSQTIIAVDPDKIQQQFEGWGTSLCWWAHGAGRWDNANLDPLIGRIVDADTGLGYSIFRYNIGGGDQPGHNHFRQFGDVPGYKPIETESYDWNADPYQRNIAQKISAVSPNAIWEAFSNSPPWWMTKSGCTAGNTDGSDNLKSEYFDDFADYQTEVVKHFRDQWKITFRTVTPFNEPSARWWTANKNQEGCGFKTNQSRMINMLGNTLLTKKLKETTVSASDENSIAEALDRAKEYSDSSLQLLTQMNTHSYNGKERRKEYGDMVSKLGKRLWQSESGPLVWPGGNQLDVSLWMADVIIKDIKELRANAWIDWQILDGGVWSSFTTDYARQKAVPNKRFYMHAQFSRFIRPGARILTIEDSNTLVAMNPSTGNLIIILLNPLAVPKDYVLDFSLLSQIGSLVAIYRTSSKEDLIKLPDMPINNRKLLLELTPQSITTLTVKATSAIGIVEKAKSRYLPYTQNHFKLSQQGSMSIRAPTHASPEAIDAQGRRIFSLKGNRPSSF